MLDIFDLVVGCQRLLLCYPGSSQINRSHARNRWVRWNERCLNNSHHEVLLTVFPGSSLFQLANCNLLMETLMWKTWKRSTC